MEWKSNRNGEIAKQFTKAHSSFKDLRESVTPLFRRNEQIFNDYGPNDESQGGERHKLWLRFEGEIISNNRRLELILTKNRSLLPKENQNIVDRFVAHTYEFLVTRDDGQIPRVCLFPREVLSIFGLAEVPVGFPPNLSALQNFITCLVDANRFVALELNEAPCVRYLNRGRNVTLVLEDRPRVQQIFWNGRFFRPKTTDVRIENLVFFAQWLYRNEIHYEFDDVCNLTEMTLNREYRVKIGYKYVLSLSDVHTMTLREGDIVVNLHNWNAAPVSDDARKYALDIGVRLFSQNDFFRFAHRDIK